MEFYLIYSRAPLHNHSFRANLINNVIIIIIIIPDVSEKGGKGIRESHGRELRWTTKSGGLWDEFLASAPERTLRQLSRRARPAAGQTDDSKQLCPPSPGRIKASQLCISTRCWCEPRHVTHPRRLPHYADAAASRASTPPAPASRVPVHCALQSVHLLYLVGISQDGCWGGDRGAALPKKVPETGQKQTHLSTSVSRSASSSPSCWCSSRSRSGSANSCYQPVVRLSPI